MKWKWQAGMTVFFLITFFAEMQGQVIPASRKVDWTIAGLRTAKPVYPNTKNIMDFGGSGNGVTANDAALQAAIASLGTDSGTIYFPAGTYYFTLPVILRSGLILKGVDAASTTLLFNLTSVDHLISAAGDSTIIISNVSASAYKDQNSITVDNGSLFQVNEYVKIFQNDVAIVNDAFAYNSVAQVLRIQSISGNTITFTSTLRRSYLLADAPKLRKQTMVTGVGIECLKIKRLDRIVSTSIKRSNINFDYAARCWVKGVESDSSNYAHIQLDNSTNIEITGSFFHGAFNYGSGGVGYGIVLEFSTGESLIENNVFRNLRHAMLLQVGANGNVLAYNYSREPYKSEGFPNNLAGDIVLHGNYPYANLFEGNIVQNIVIDVSHGINGPFNTMFRNRAELYGILMSNGSGDSTNLVGNEMTSTTAFQGNYSVAGNGNLEHGNNKNGTILPNGTNTLTDNSYYLSAAPAFWNVGSTWPSIGIPNTINVGTTPAYARYIGTNTPSICPVSAPTIFTFNGNGDWNSPANWAGNLVGPVTIASGIEVIITPSTGGQCNYTGQITVEQGGKLTLPSGNTLQILKN